MAIWDEFRHRFTLSGGPKMGGMPSRALIAYIRGLILATTGEVVGWGVGNEHEAAAELFEADWSALMGFLTLLETTGRPLDETAKQPPGLWLDLAMLRREWPNGSQSFYKAKSRDFEAVKWLFPDLELPMARMSNNRSSRTCNGSA